MEKHRTLNISKNLRVQSLPGKCTEGFGIVYFVFLKNGYVKIGKSKTPLARLKTITGSYPSDMTASVHVTEEHSNYSETESYLLKNFRASKEDREVLKASYQDIERCLKNWQPTFFKKEIVKTSDAYDDFTKEFKAVEACLELKLVEKNHKTPEGALVSIGGKFYKDLYKTKKELHNYWRNILRAALTEKEKKNSYLASLIQ